ncbi:MAG: hypothetical protein ACRDA7_00935 [Metamycoplasmataceae bacterium]
MIYFETEKKLIKTWLVIFTISIVIMLGLLYLSYTYLTGFLIGFFGSTISFIVNYFFVTKLLSKKRNKGFVILMSFARFFSIMAINVMLIIMVLNVNKLVGTKSSLDGIFNFWTFLFGLTISYISIFLANIIDSLFKKTKLKNKEVINAN